MQQHAPKVHARPTHVDPLRADVLDAQEDWRLARAGYLELLSMGMPTVNWLLIGRDGAIQKLIEVLPFGAVLRTWRAGETFMLPVGDENGTVLLRDVDGLTLDEQRYLLDWLDRPDRWGRVVSTTVASLLPRVYAGAFLETLYYRLNTICVDVTA